MRFRSILVVLSVISLIAIVVCTRKSYSESGIDKGSSNTVIKDNFEITVTKSKNSYSLDKLFTTEPLSISATVKYIGEKDSIKIWHSNPLCAISLIPKDGESELGGQFLEEKLSSIVDKDRLYSFTPDFLNEYYKSELEKGHYTAIAHLKLTLDEEGTQKVDYTTEISFDIK